MRLRFRYSLRTFFICCLIIGCGLGWLGMKMKAARQQAATVAEIRSLPCSSVYYDYQLELIDEWQQNPSRTTALPPSMDPPEPAWLIDLFGVDLFHKVESYTFRTRECKGHPPTSTKEKRLELLRELPDLRIVRLLPHAEEATEMAEFGFERVAALTKLETLDIHDTPVTREQLGLLRDRHHLKNLWMHDCRPEPGAMASLGHLPAIETLALGEAPHNREDIQTICSWRTLKSLSMCNVPTDDWVLNEVSQLRQLESLQVNEKAEITFEGLRAIQRLPLLNSLTLNHRKLTDEELAFIPGQFPSLVYLEMQFSQSGPLTIAAIQENRRMKWVHLEHSTAEKQYLLHDLQTQRPDLTIEGIVKKKPPGK